MPALESPSASPTLSSQPLMTRKSESPQSHPSPPLSQRPLAPQSPLLVARASSHGRAPSSAVTAQFSASAVPAMPMRGRSASVSGASGAAAVGASRPSTSPSLATASPSLHAALESLRQRKDEELLLQKHFMAATLGAELSRQRDSSAHEKQQHVAALHAMERQRAQLQSRLQDSEAGRLREQTDAVRRSEQAMQAMREELSRQQMYSAALVAQLQSQAQRQQQERERQQTKDEAMMSELMRTVTALQQEVAGMRAQQSGSSGGSQQADTHWRQPIIFHRSTGNWYDHYDVPEWGRRP